MKPFLKPIALLFCLAVAVSCKKQAGVEYVEPIIDNPITDYDVTPDPTDAFTFKFTNKTTNFKRLEWRFGDDTLNTTENPTHTYLRTGKYTVDLKAFSKTTSASTRKFADLNIVADSIVKITSTRGTTTPGFGEVVFGITVKAPVQNIEWRFDDVQYNTSTGTVVPPATVRFNSTSTTVTPKRTYSVGTFNTVTVTLTTPNGSVATITRGVTTEGIAEDITQKRSEYSTVLEWNNNPANANGNEGSSKLLDNNVATKFGTYGLGQNVKNWAFTIKYTAPQTIKLYMVANANDSEGFRDPQELQLDGSNDQGLTWTNLAIEPLPANGFYQMAINAGITANGSAANPGRYFRKWYFTVPQAKQAPYSWIRLSIPKGTWGSNRNGSNMDALQLSEFALYR